jgi:hypothetical protein
MNDRCRCVAAFVGNVYGWTMAKDGRIDCVSASGRSSSAILALAVDCPLLMFRKVWIVPTKYNKADVT